MAAVVLTAEADDWDQPLWLAQRPARRPVPRQPHPGHGDRPQQVRKLALQAEGHRAAVGETHGEEAGAVEAQVLRHPLKDGTREGDIVRCRVGLARGHARVPAEAVAAIRRGAVRVCGKRSRSRSSAGVSVGEKRAKKS